MFSLAKVILKTLINEFLYINRVLWWHVVVGVSSTHADTKSKLHMTNPSHITANLTT